MPTKSTKKKIPPKEEKEEITDEKPSVRHVVEVVKEEQDIPEAIETIKRDTLEIEEAVEEIEEHIEDDHKVAPDLHNVEPEMVDHRTAVQSLFAKERDNAVAPAITVEAPKEKSIGVWVGLMFGIVAAIGVSLLLFVKGPESISSFVVKPTPTPTSAPDPTPTVQMISRKDVRVRVVNGGGVSGAGAKMRTFLEDKGYTVVSVGNASQYDNKTTEIRVKDGNDDIAKLLYDDLKVDYSMGSTSATLDSDEEFDALVTVGSEE